MCSTRKVTVAAVRAAWMMAAAARPALLGRSRLSPGVGWPAGCWSSGMAGSGGGSCRAGAPATGGSP
eukprot:11193630-Lingulodinium_polyedra.AAC.1